MDFKDYLDKRLNETLSLSLDKMELNFLHRLLWFMFDTGDYDMHNLTKGSINYEDLLKLYAKSKKHFERMIERLVQKDILMITKEKDEILGDEQQMIKITPNGAKIIISYQDQRELEDPEIVTNNPEIWASNKPIKRKTMTQFGGPHRSGAHSGLSY